jgi:membrane-associated phospholipid phosphatase
MAALIAYRAGSVRGVDHEVRAPRSTPRFSLRPIHPNGWWLDALMVVGFAAVTAALLLEPVRQFDLAIRDLADSNRPAGADVAAQLVNRLGSGGILSGTVLVLALLLAWLCRSPWPVAPVIGAFLLTSIVIQPLKLIFHRAAPHSPLPDEVEVRLFSQPDGLSYPSGHAVNTIVWYGVIALLLAAWIRPVARRWLRFAPPVLVGVANVYLGYHWVTDMLAGICLGIVIDRLIARTPWPKVGPPNRATGSRAAGSRAGPADPDHNARA